MKHGNWTPHNFVNRQPRFLVVWTLDWAIVEFQRFEAGADLHAAMLAALARLAAEGWGTETQPTFGCCFIRRAGTRRLLMLTPRDPRDEELQSFSPFR